MVIPGKVNHFPDIWVPVPVNLPDFKGLSIQKLREDGSGVYEISDGISFGDSGRLIRCFQRHVEITPAEFCAQSEQK